MFTVSGRSTRTEVVSFYLLYMVAVLAFVMAHFLMPFELLFSPLVHGLTTAFQALFTFPYLALFVRRLHDQDRSLKWLWIVVAHFVAVIGLMLVPEAEDGILSINSFGWVRHPAMSPHSVALLIASIASAIALLILFFAAGTEGPNRYGPDPRV